MTGASGKQPDRSIEHRILDIVERTLASAADGERAELLRHAQPILVGLAGTQPVVNVNRNENYNEEKTVTQNEEKPGGGLSVGGLGGIHGEHVEVNLVQGDQHKGDTTQTSRKTTVPPEMTDALASLRALLEGVEGEDGEAMSKDLAEVDGAFGEAAGAEEAPWAKKGFDALRRFWRVAEKLPEVAEKAQALAEKLGGFLGEHCSTPWLDTFR